MILKRNLPSGIEIIFNTSFSSEYLRNEELIIQSMDELKVYLMESKKYLGDIFDNHCKDPSWRPGANDFEILFNSMVSTFHAVAPLLTIAVNSLQINDKTKRFLKKDVDYSFDFNSFLTMFKQAAEENLSNNSMQIQATLEIIINVGQN
jgi:hypothetical protein